jgi:two-component system, LuxR family, sensor kinase FixL
MNWVTIIYPLTASACLALALIFGSIWRRQRESSANLSGLRLSEQQIALAAKAANMGFWFKDFGREEFSASSEWRTLFGFTSSEGLDVDRFLQRVHPSDREATRQALENAYQGDGNYQTEHRVLMPDGQVRWFACHGHLSSSHRPLRLEGVSLEITQRKLAELEAQVHRDEATHLLRVASLGELSSSLAHELRQPLTAILCNAQAAQILLARGPVDTQEVRHILDDIVADEERAGNVIDRLHMLLKKREFEPQSLDANQLIQEVLRFMKHELTGRSMRIVEELSSDVLLIHGDRVQLQQVLINLILNALDSMSHTKSEQKLTVRSRRAAGDLVQISVADTGIGIPAGRVETIFRPYYTTKPRGLGLGLSLSRSILVAHRGSLWAENNASGGATFHCSIPESRPNGV